MNQVNLAEAQGNDLRLSAPVAADISLSGSFPCLPEYAAPKKGLLGG